MAVTAKSYFSNAIVGVPQVGANVNIYKEDTSPQFAIATKFERQDGAVFRYGHFGATIASAGLLCSVDVSESGQEFKEAAVVASSSTYQMPNETTGVYPCMLGSKYLIVTLASVTTDMFAGGYITMSSGPSPSSHTYRIKGNTATDTPDSGNFRVELYDRLQAGVGASQGITITGSRYANLEASLAATGTDLPAGVSMVPITTAGDYGWVLTKGITGVLASASTILAGRAVSMSTVTAGAVDLAQACVTSANAVATTDTVYGVYIPGIIGYSCSNSSANQFVPVAVNLE